MLASVASIEFVCKLDMEKLLAVNGAQVKYTQDWYISCTILVGKCAVKMRFGRREDVWEDYIEIYNVDVVFEKVDLTRVAQDLCEDAENFGLHKAENI